MMADQKTQQSPVTPAALAEKWATILNQAFISIIALEDAIDQQNAVISKLAAEAEGLRAEAATQKQKAGLSASSEDIARLGSDIIKAGQLPIDN